MDIVELLQIRGFDTKAKTKMLRHLSGNYDVHDMHRRGHFEIYQSFQRSVKLDCQYVIGFLGLPQGRALFVGVWEVTGRSKPKDVPIPPNYPYQEFWTNAKRGTVFYQMKKCTGFDDLIDRVVVDWGAGTRSWHQWLTKKEVVEMLPKGYVKEFPGFLELSLTFRELQEILTHPSANREWHLMLRSVAGVYLILDTKTGLHYVGSAYGNGGILDRWRTYGTTGHGGNLKLKKLLQKEPNYAENFKFSILHTLAKSTMKNEVIHWESRFKTKLGSRAFGLNT